nr:DUF2807 domain-containing protein [Anaerolineae bacterium]
MNRVNSGVVVLLLVAAICSGCVLKVVEGSGNVVTETRDLGEFSSVTFSGLGKLVIIQGQVESLSIQTDDNIMEYITSEVTDGNLDIGLQAGAFSISAGETNVIRPSRGITYNLTVVNLESLTVSGAGIVDMETLSANALILELSGTGSIKIDDLQATTLNATITGAGNMTLAGVVSSQTVQVTGLGRYKADDLQSVDSVVDLDSAGTIQVWSTGTLDITLSGAGSIDYYGSPSVTEDITGAGTITNKGSK